MIMNNCMLPDILQRLREVNTLLATYKQGELSFEQALPPSLFYQDFNDTNILVKEAACLVRENPGELLEFSSSLFSETDKYLSLDRTPLQKVDFAAMSNRLDFLPLDSEEYKSLDAECSAAKAEYDEVHAHANLLYEEWQQERDRYFCVWCFKPVFLDVLVERLKGIAGSIISDIGRMKEGKP